MVTPSPDARNRENTGFSPAEVLSGLCEICPTESAGVGLAREIRTDREAESLAAWADAKGALWTEERPPKTDALTGGEHLVEIDEPTGTVFKTTHPGKFGFSVDLEMILNRNAVRCGDRKA